MRVQVVVKKTSSNSLEDIFQLLSGKRGKDSVEDFLPAIVARARMVEWTHTGGLVLADKECGNAMKENSTVESKGREGTEGRKWLRKCKKIGVRRKAVEVEYLKTMAEMFDGKLGTNKTLTMNCLAHCWVDQNIVQHS